ncbi:MAG: hypothetical protein P4N60_02305 [Verrucomicrobiae bacterium]|nr:hypothetical protein [Verrucomicrobiae bacterium]
MKKVKKSPALERAEWDFRQIEDHALKAATMWEYGRSCDNLNKSVVLFLETKIDGVKIRQHVAQGGQSSCGVFFKAIPELIASNIISKDCFDRILDLSLFMLSNGHADFPAPWTAVKHRKPKPWTPNDSHILEIYSYLNNREICDKKLQEKIDEPEFLASDNCTYLMEIKWDANVDKIMAQFSKWVRAEAKNHPRPLGQQAQAYTHPLKCLSAYRLQQAGYTFPTAQEFLRKYNDGGRLVPVYANASGWSDAISFARKTLEKLASNNY